MTNAVTMMCDALAGLVDGYEDVLRLRREAIAQQRLGETSKAVTLSRASKARHKRLLNDAKPILTSVRTMANMVQGGGSPKGYTPKVRKFLSDVLTASDSFYDRLLTDPLEKLDEELKVLERDIQRALGHLREVELP